jgi:hypothetical protein
VRSLADDLLEPAETAAPEPRVAAEPVLDFAEAVGGEGIDSLLASYLDIDQPRCAQGFQVLRDRRGADGKPLGDFAGAAPSQRKDLHHAAAVRVGQRQEGVHAEIMNLLLN